MTLSEAPTADDMRKLLTASLPGFEWQLTEHRHKITLQARRFVEFFETDASNDYLAFHAEAALAILRELVEKARRKAIADYGLEEVIAEERERAAREARLEVMTALRAKLNEHRNSIEALDEHGAIVQVRGPLPEPLAELYVWANGGQG